MRKLALLSLALFIGGMLVGCRNEPTTPPPSPTTPPSPTPTLEAPTAAPTVDATAAPASCVADPFDPAESGVPPVTENDLVRGPSDASITFIEYADFQ
jgi:hypothetical protein